MLCSILCEKQKGSTNLSTNEFRSIIFDKILYLRNGPRHFWGAIKGFGELNPSKLS